MRTNLKQKDGQSVLPLSLAKCSYFKFQGIKFQSFLVIDHELSSYRWLSGYSSGQSGEGEINRADMENFHQH